MTKLLSIGLFCCALACSATATTAQTKAPTTASDVPSVTLCELVRNPHKYDQRVVRLEAVYSVNFESVLLYDWKCDEKGSYIYPNISGGSREASRELQEKITTNLKYGQGSGDRVGLLMRGLFLAPRPNRHIREAGNEWSKFEIMEIERVIEIPEDAPPPGRGAAAEQRKPEASDSEVKKAALKKPALF